MEAIPRGPHCSCFSSLCRCWFERTQFTAPRCAHQGGAR